MRHHAAILGLALMASAAWITAIAQAQIPDAQPDLAFEVASVRPSKGQTPTFEFGPPQLRMGSALVEALIRTAYGIRNMYEIDGIPPALKTARFTIAAKYPDGATIADLPRLVRSLLHDRFRLAAHVEPRERRAFALVRARPDGALGSQLIPTTTDRRTDAEKAAGRPYWGTSGRNEVTVQGGRRRINYGTLVELTILIDTLAAIVSTPIIDRTGLTGTFNYEFTFDPDALKPTPSVSDAPNIFTAIEKQLGLKLESARAPIDVLVIDHIEFPTSD